MKLALLASLLVVLVGCVTGATKPQDVITTACAPSDQYLIERCAEAVGDVYMVFQRRALEIVSDPATPEEIKGSLKSLDRELTPAVRTLVQTSAAYVLLREAQSPDAGAKQAELAGQLATVQPRVQSLPKL